MDFPEQLVREIHEELIARLDLRRTDVTRMQDVELRRVARRLLGEIISQREIPANVDKVRLETLLVQEVVGLGAIEDLLEDDSITEVMVNGASQIFVERAGRLERSPVRFSSTRTLSGVIERLLQPTGRRVDESSPMTDARLPDGSRVNVVIPPLAVRGPAVTIRKFSRKRLELTDLLATGALSVAMAEFLRIAIVDRRNIVVSGGTGSGKTTLLNVLSSLIPDSERIVTIEDAAELQLHHRNLVTLEARPHNQEGKGLVSIRDLVRNALRMRPDRIVVGECRGGEALDMLQAMNTGHNGSLTTAHANSPRDLLSRLEVMVLMAGMDLPVAAIREQVASAVNIIVQQARFACGARKIVLISEVTGMDAGRIQMQDIFKFEPEGVDASGRTRGTFTGCGNAPVFLETLRRRDLLPDLTMFDRRQS
jgi:pilus assembly protein CpaF